MLLLVVLLTQTMPPSDEPPITPWGNIAGLHRLSTSVFAHDEAEWIERDSSYVDENGKHCCGPGDCVRFTEEYFRQNGGSIFFFR